jgi:hypothetical protein
MNAAAAPEAQSMEVWSEKGTPLETNLWNWTNTSSDLRVLSNRYQHCWTGFTSIFSWRCSTDDEFEDDELNNCRDSDKTQRRDDKKITHYATGSSFPVLPTDSPLRWESFFER